jgi:Ni2+-binding GTPase involved in maturation of urease and hydrogenase
MINPVSSGKTILIMLLVTAISAAGAFFAGMHQGR